MAGVQVTIADYDSLPAMVRDDLVVWEESRIMRHNAEVARANRKGGASLRNDDLPM